MDKRASKVVTAAQLSNKLLDNCGMGPCFGKGTQDIHPVPAIPERSVRSGERTGPRIPVQPPGQRKPVDGGIDPFPVGRRLGGGRLGALVRGD